MTKSVMEQAFLGLVIAFNVIYLIGAREASFGNAWDPGPGYLPVILGGFTLLLSIIQFIDSHRHSDKEKVADFAEGNLRSLYIYILTLVLFVALYSSLGPLALFLLFLTLAKTSGFAGWLYPSLFAGAFTLAGYVIFYEVLFIQLPMGIFGNLW